MLHPEMEKYNDNQLQWYSYLRGELDDTTRIDSPYIAMQTAFLSEGVVLSSELGRSVTARRSKQCQNQSRFVSRKHHLVRSSMILMNTNQNKKVEA